MDGGAGVRGPTAGRPPGRGEARGAVREGALGGAGAGRSAGSGRADGAGDEAFARPERPVRPPAEAADKVPGAGETGGGAHLRRRIEE
ncbi:MAG: hypothetical protein DRH15_14915 [Deltaproteobacteria bacterium]|nr:MAG: hypothetical protein DRH15_14915 [Deltaproteobacteria bacterium]